MNENNKFIKKNAKSVTPDQKSVNSLQLIFLLIKKFI